MKIRTGFVSNSSSSSFVIKKSDLTELQIKQIKNHWIITEAVINAFWDYLPIIPEDVFEEEESGWEICETDTEIKGSTTVENYHIHYLMQVIGISDDKIKWSN
jgi:hypothetical protein